MPRFLRLLLPLLVGIVLIAIPEPSIVAGVGPQAAAQPHAAGLPANDEPVEAGPSPPPTLESATSGSVDAAMAASGQAAVAALELELFDLTNRSRLANGLPSMQPDGPLLNVARARAADQSPTAALSHYDARGQIVFSRLIDGLGLRYNLAGENLARVPAPAATAAERAEHALMESPGHRANILEPVFDRLAVGAVTDAEGRIVFAQIFRAAAGP